MTRTSRESMAEGLALFIREAAALHEYIQVLWGVSRYRELFALNPVVEMCSVVASANMGDQDGALAGLEGLRMHGCNWEEIASLLGDVVGRRVQLREFSSDAVLAVILESIGAAESHRVFHRMHGN